MDIRNILLSVEALGKLSDDEDVIEVLRDTWVELRQMEVEVLKRMVR